MSLLNSASLVVTPNGYKEGTLYSVIPNTTLGDMTVVRATTATRVNSAGLIESMANNVPRLDYSNGSCPSLLVEPQRTNLFTYSEQLQTGTSGTITVTPNTAISPDGTQNADSLGAGYLTKSISATSGTWTYSAFVKYLSSNTVNIYIYDGVYYDATFNVSTGVVTSSSAGVTASIQNMGNGWYRCIMTATTANNVSEVGFNSGNVYAWGAQLEAGSYPTSYIPTTSAAVTRNADAIYKTGISSLIGQTSGSVFFDFTVDTISSQTSDPVLWYMKDGGVGERYVELYSSGNLAYVEYTTLTISNIVKTGLTVGRHKCAIAYAANDFVFYVDGVQVGTDTSGTPSGFSTFALQYYNSTYLGQQYVNSVAIFPTRLTNAELASLTT